MLMSGLIRFVFVVWQYGMCAPVVIRAFSSSYGVVAEDYHLAIVMGGVCLGENLFSGIHQFQLSFELI